jgi:ureidoglycolate lyase
MPLRIEFLERHPLGSQAFVPLHREPFLLVVARAGQAPKTGEVRAFITNGHQGVNYHKGTWHHYLVAPVDGARFLIIDRMGPGKNYEEHVLEQPLLIESMRAG